MSACYTPADFDYSEYSDSALQEALQIWQAPNGRLGTECDIDLVRRKIAAIRDEIARRNLDMKP